jgi:hypothetical protein
VENRTPHGRHYYFRTDARLRNNAGKLGLGLDGRGDGGYVVGAGSVNDQGKRYRYARGRSPDEIEIAEIPPWLFALASKNRSDDGHSSNSTRVQSGIPTTYAAAALRGEADDVRWAPEGTRNNRLNIAAFSMGQLVGAGEIDIAVVKADLTSAAQAAGLEGAEIQATIDSGLADGQTHPRDRTHPERSQAGNLAQQDPLLGELAKLGESDTDNGRRLVTRYGHRLHFVPERNQWFVFDGRVWREDTAKCRLRYAQDSARLISDEADLRKGARPVGSGRTSR